MARQIYCSRFTTVRLKSRPSGGSRSDRAVDLVVAGSSTCAEPTVTTVMTELDNPRGLD